MFGEVLPYLEVKKENEEEKEDVEVPNLIGLTIKEAKKLLLEKELEIKINENSEIEDIKSQVPKAGIKVKKGTAIIVD